MSRRGIGALGVALRAFLMLPLGGGLMLSSCAAPGLEAAAAPQAQAMVAGLWELEVDPAQIGAFKAIGVENLIQLADDPTQVRVLEVYANQDAYQAHIRTPHFLKYKNGTEKMVQSLELPLANPIMLAAKPAEQRGSPVTCG
jgi:hypothetical protein